MDVITASQDGERNLTHLKRHENNNELKNPEGCIPDFLTESLTWLHPGLVM
jgi:hypothetical protein